ncbi:cytochrome P450 9e2-like [Onthophagus taurus]|uniref:cytochrome P450 9e2-like n=1 Tax=Onthophagus taurus TaxID=166361 RepID=UPI0039BDCC9B
MYLILILIFLITLFYYKAIKPYSYWTQRGVKQRKQIYLLGDNAGQIFKRESFYGMIKNLYEHFPQERYFGMYQMLHPTLLLRDPELIKTITIKDFDHFVNHKPLLPESSETIWTKNILLTQDDDWRQVRVALTPNFTSNKMKLMFGIIFETTNTYVKHFQNLNDKVYEVELKDLMTRYAIDIISTIAFGFKCDSINDKNNEFYIKGVDLGRLDFKRVLKFFAFDLFPTLSNLIKIKVFPRSLSSFFENIIKTTIKLREEQGIVRGDMIDFLLQSRDKMEDKNLLSDENITAHAFSFFFGGFESTSTVLSFMGYELAINPEIQQKLQEEIDKTFQECNGNLTYDALQKMRYMDMVVSETLRKWPPNPFTDRVCVKPYTIPPTNQHEQSLNLEVGQTVWIPIYGLHNDPEYFPNPTKFDPERFNEENKQNIPSGVYVPFGMGPRNCIGSRMALLEIKLFFFNMLANFDFIQINKTENPLKLVNYGLTLITENGIWVGLKPRMFKN